MFNKKAHL